MEYLVATDSVHTTAVACDYLVERLDPDDGVTVLGIEPPDGGGSRDTGDALNVANARLAGRATTRVEQGEPAETILAAAAGVDVLVLGRHGGRPGAGPEMGSTARAVVEEATVPVVVLPVERL
jgi:nucleotide-binding universal stress UspA family protein